MFDTKYYQEVDTQYKQLLSRQQVLEKKQRDSKKTDIGMSEKEQQEYQSNISALTGLKRSIKKVCFLNIININLINFLATTPCPTSNSPHDFRHDENHQ